MPKPHANGRGQFLQGQIIVRRDDADRPTLPNPRTFFILRPLPECRSTAAPEQDQADRDAENPFNVKLQFTWTRGMTRHVDTLDDVRRMISNRDLRYRNGAEAFDALLAELGLKKRRARRHGAERGAPFVGFDPKTGKLTPSLIPPDMVKKYFPDIEKGSRNPSKSRPRARNRAGGNPDHAWTQAT